MTCSSLSENRVPLQTECACVRSLETSSKKEVAVTVSFLRLHRVLR